MSLSDLTQLRRDPDVSIVMSIVKQLLSWCVLSVSVTACGMDVGHVEPTDAVNPIDSWSGMPAIDLRDPVERVQEYWTKEHGSAPGRCVDKIGAVWFNYVAAPEPSCPAGTAGCEHDGEDVFIVQRWSDSNDLKTHELMHVMYDCTHGKGFADAGHADTVWLHIPVSWEAMD